MIIDQSLLVNSGTPSAVPERPIRMGFFHFPNANLSIRKQCARELGMYDPLASKGEDVDLCFRVALSPRWVAWREDAAVVRHKGRRTLWGLITQMWGWVTMSDIRTRRPASAGSICTGSMVANADSSAVKPSHSRSLSASSRRIFIWRIYGQ